MNTRILIAEDNEDLREFLAYLMNFYDYSYQIAANGKEALQLILSNDSGDFDLVLSDIDMPLMNGFEFFRALRAEGFNIPFILMTASLTEVSLNLATELGIQDILEKPFGMSEFQQRLNQALSRREMLEIVSRQKGIISR